MNCSPRQNKTNAGTPTKVRVPAFLIRRAPTAPGASRYGCVLNQLRSPSIMLATFGASFHQS
jgi:hypothetical protein